MRPVTYVVPEQVRVVLLEAVVQYGDHYAQASNTFHPGRLHIHVQSLPTVLQHKRTIEANAKECGNNQSVLLRMIPAFLKYGKKNKEK
jgi:predicted hotdog family 3-hydroxylacyl-ACP dehydratase